MSNLYLNARPEIDANKIYLLGISLGAMLGAHSLAMEPRFSGGILMYCVTPSLQLHKLTLIMI